MLPYKQYTYIFKVYLQFFYERFKFELRIMYSKTHSFYNMMISIT